MKKTKIISIKNKALEVALSELIDFEVLRMESESVCPLPENAIVSTPAIKLIETALATNS